MVSAVGVAAVLVLVAVLASVVRRRRRVVPQWELLVDDHDLTGRRLSVVKIGERDAFRVQVSGSCCTVDVTTDGVSGELRLPEGFSLPVVRLGSTLHTTVQPDPTGGEPAELVIEWWDWSEPTSGRRGRRRHQTRFALAGAPGSAAAL